MKSFAKLLLVFGIVMIALSLILRTENQPGSPEEIVNTLNIGIGAMMVVLASVYLFLKRKKKSREDQSSTKKTKGEKNIEDTEYPHQVL